MDFQLKRTFGQVESREKLKKSLSADKVPTPLLIYGTSGLGQVSLALDLAEGIICLASHLRPCGQCAPCQEFTKRTGNNVRFLLPLSEPHQKNRNFRIEETAGKTDLLFSNPYGYYPAPGEHISVAQVRDLRESLTFAEEEGSHRVVVILFPETLGIPSANALLKILEEPPKNTFFILASESKEALLPTILSRCVQLRLSPVTENAWQDFLTAHPDWSPQRAEKWRRVCRNSPGRLHRFLSREDDTLLEAAHRFLECSAQGSWPEFSALLEEEDSLHDPEKAALVLELALEIFRTGSAQNTSWGSQFSEWEGLPPHLASRYIQFLDQALKAIRHYCRPNLAFMGGFFHWEAQRARDNSAVV